MCLEMFMIVFSGKRKRFYKVRREQNQKQSNKTAFLMAEGKKNWLTFLAFPLLLMLYEVNSLLSPSCASSFLQPPHAPSKTSTSLCIMEK